MDSFFVVKGINVSCRTIEGIAFILDQNGGLLIKLDEVGSFIWDQIYGVRTVRQVSEICCKSFDGDVAEIHASVEAFIADLHEKNLLLLSPNQFSEEVASVC